MKYKCAIFDLDGTLIDTFGGILWAIDMTFNELNISFRLTDDEIKKILPQDIGSFIKQAATDAHLNKEEQDKLIKSFTYYYGVGQSTRAAPYEHCLEMLNNLRKHNVLVTIASNKPQNLVEEVTKHFFPNFEFDYMIGKRDDILGKPNPQMLYEVMKKYNLSLDEVVFVGDTESDYKTAKNAKMDCILCKYGYGLYDDSWTNGATDIATCINDVEDILLNKLC